MQMCMKDEPTSVIQNSCQVNAVLLSCCFATIISRTGLWKQRLRFSLLLISYNTATVSCYIYHH